MITLGRLHLGWRLVQLGTWVSGLRPAEPVERPALHIVKDRA